MNFRTLQDMVLRAGHLPVKDCHRRQVAREVINSAARGILLRYRPWSFMQRKVEILTEAGEPSYALPLDFERVLAFPSLEGVRMEGFRPNAAHRYGNSENITEAMGRVSYTIDTLSILPYAASGTIFPVFGSDVINGLSTGFDGTMVDRYLRSQRDGQVYKIASVSNATKLTLKQEYSGNSVSGLVNAYAGDLTKVFGRVNQTNFRFWMVGATIQIEVNGVMEQRIIDVVEEDEQWLILDSALSAATSNAVYSISDSYKIDPEGVMTITIVPTPTIEDQILLIPYEAKYVDMTGDFDVPVIPDSYHQTLLHASIAEFYSLNRSDMVDVAYWEAKTEQGISGMILRSDPMEETARPRIEPDPVRIRSTSNAR